MQYQAKDFYQIQNEVIEAKVNIAVSRSIDRVVDQIAGLSGNVNRLENKMHEEIHDLKSSMESRLVAVETKLGMSSETQGLIKAKIIEYAFKTGWAILAAVTVFAIAHIHVTF